MSLPVLSQPAMDPPTMALPPVPSTKPPRKSLPHISSRTKPPSRPSAIPTSQATFSNPEVHTLKSAAHNAKSALPTSQPTLRKVVSIGSFPQPPRSASRAMSDGPITSPASPRKRVSDGGRTSVAASTRGKRTPRSSTASTVNSFRMSEGNSLLQSAGDGRTIPVVNNKRASDGQSSVPSPPMSRSSSASGSYSTNATTLDEVDEDRGRTRESEEMGDKRNSRGKEHKGNVIVSVRVRPDTGSPETGRTEGEWMVDGRRALVAYRGKEGGDYHYDNVFGVYDDNARVYDSSAKRLVRRVMEGYHGTVFAYGMTGTGKTFSMQGTTSSPGVIPLAITDIFSYIRETPHREFLLRVSYLEIYNEKIHDLLAASAGTSTGTGTAATQQEEIRLREDPKRGVYAFPLKEEIVQSPTQLLRVIHRGDMARRTGSTQYNTRSSRSHAVVQIVVESRERHHPGGSQRETKRIAMLPSGVRVSTLSLIDLAGSERAADDKERRNEGAYINKSLLTLGTVIAKLSGNRDRNGNPMDKDGKHLPYRDSKLTRLLQPALSGNSLVSILCTIQIGSQGSSGETLNTLKFAARAKNNIVSHAKKAIEELGSGVNAGLLERYRAEIASLRSQLENQQKASNDREDKEDEEGMEEGGEEEEEEEEGAVAEKNHEREAQMRHEEQMLEMQLARTALKERIEHLNRLILCSKSTGVNSGTTSSLGMHPRYSNGTVGEFAGARSIRSSASHSTLGTLGLPLARHPSMTSIGGGPSTYSPPVDDDEDSGDHGDGRASLQAQNRALQADLQDKNRYITTLEKRLLQARRSSHSRTSVGLNRPGQDAKDILKQMDEKDATIADLQKTVTALRSAMRQRTVADMAPVNSSIELKSKKVGRTHQGKGSTDSSPSLPTRPVGEKGVSPNATLSPVALLSPQKQGDNKRRSVDEMSKMLDEMIQDKVESGHLVKGRSGSVRIPSRTVPPRGLGHSRRSSSVNEISAPPLNVDVAASRERHSISTTPDLTVPTPAAQE